MGEADSGSSIEDSYATGAISGSGVMHGGLVGYLNGGSISGSFGTGAISGTSFVGGLVGESEEGAISNSYAMGSVSGTSGVGGLVGALFDPSSSVADSFSIGMVTGSSHVGGLVGEQSDSGGVADSYWDTQTSGIGTDNAGAVPLTTAQMQGTFANMTAFAGPTWATGAGLFPYLSWQFSGTPQAISGIAYGSGGGSVLQGGTVSGLLDGNALGTASTGANGYYYLLAAPGTISAGNHALLVDSSANGVRVDMTTDALDANNNVSGFDVWGNTLIAPTSDTTYSTASATSLQTQELIAHRPSRRRQHRSDNEPYELRLHRHRQRLHHRPINLAGPWPLRQTRSGNLTVADPITLAGANGLTLASSNALTIDAPIAITGGGALTLDYSTTALTNLSFGLTSSGFAGGVNYGSTNNGGTLTINGAAYTLLYSMTDLQNVNNALTGNYALATSLDASAVSSWTPLGTDSSGVVLNSNNGFSGAFEGLGNTVSNLTMNGTTEGAGLFGDSAFGSIRDIGLSGISIISSKSDIGGLVGLDGNASTASNGSTIADSYVTGSVSGFGAVGGLVGKDGGGAIDGSYTTAAVNASLGAGGLVGEFLGGAITESYATGAVTGLSQIGGLVGRGYGTISASYAIGAVTVIDNGAGTAGGFIGAGGPVTISNSYATGAVNGGAGGERIGGFAGSLSSGTITTSYSTGTVSGGTMVGGFVGQDYTTGGITNSYWDMDTSGFGASAGAGNISNNSGISGMHTTGLQGTLPSGLQGGAWSTGAGLYPYLSWQFNGTPQAISGIAYRNGGGSVLQGGTVSGLLDGNALGTASTGANGYYYLLAAPGTISAGNHALLVDSSANGVRVDTTTDALDANNNVSFFDVWGNTLIAPTSDTTYSTASATSLQTQDASLIAQAVGANTDPTTGITNYGYIATGGGFVVDQPLTLSNGLYVKTTAGNIGVDDALTLSGTNGLELNAAGALTIDAPISITGAGALALDYSTASPTNLSFGLTSSGFTGGVNYAIGSGEGIAGQSLTINDTPYTLIYSTTDLQNINSGNLDGKYALATSLNASTTTGWAPLGVNGSGGVLNGGEGFDGTFEGLGNTISNLTVTNPGGYSFVGLFGYSDGTIRDFGMTGGSVTGTVDVGGLAAVSGGTILDTFNTGSVTGTEMVGGLVGDGDGGSITNSYTTGAVGSSSYHVATVGGLVGESNANISDSYATGSVSGWNIVGGFVGDNSGFIRNSYATGTVSINGGSIIGGFAAVNDLKIWYSYSTGYINASGGTVVGGFVGEDLTHEITDSYWDMSTSGIGATQGAGNVMNDSGITGETTGGLQGTLPGGFLNTVWSTGAGLYPYLSWQFTGTPQAISGKVFSGSTALTGENVGLLVDGTAVAPAIDMTSGANGYYYLLLAPGTISGSGSDIVAYLTSGTPANTFVQGVTGTHGNVDLFENTFVAASHASDSAAILAELPTALGSASGPQFLYTAGSGVVSGVNLLIYDTAAAFTLDSSLDVGDGMLELYTTGSDTQTAGTISANKLSSVSTGGLSLTDSGNAIGQIASLANSGTGGVAVTDAQTLTVTGAISTGSDEIALTTGPASNIIITGHLVGGTVDLVSAGGIDEDRKGFIHASTLEGSAHSNVLFNGPNKIAALGDFTTNSGGGFEFYDWATLDVTGTVRTTNAYYNSTHHSLTLIDETGDLDIDGEVFSGGGKMTLTSVHGEVAGTGAVDAQDLAVSANTGIDLDGTNNDILDIVTDTTSSGTNIIDTGH